MRQPAGNHAYPHQNGTGYYAPTQQPSTSSYGPVYYAINSHGADAGSHTFESRRRDYEALNDFFGDAKRRQFNPASYADVGDRLMAFQGLQLPMIHGGVMPDYQSAPAMVSVGGGGGGSYGPGPQHQYALPPMPNLRTKNDLLNIDQFLEQMQATVYENPSTAAAAGVPYPGTHVVQGGLNFRQSNSPPGVQLPPTHLTHRGSTASAMVPTSSQSTHSGTPALTPPSSAVSYTSTNSPMSAASGSSASPHSHATGGMYPTLPATSAQVTMAGYPASSTAPTSVLGTVFDNDQRRRYSGGMLQKAFKPPRDREPDVTDPPEPISPRSRHGSTSTDVPPKKSTSPSLIDPTLSSGVSSPDDSEADRAQDAWVDNIRVIEALRKFIAKKLEKGEFDNDTDTDLDEDMNDAAASSPAPQRDEDSTTREMTDAENLYPVLKAVEGHA